MQRQIIVVMALLMLGFACQTMAQSGEAGSLYLVMGTGGPGFTSPQEAAQVLEKAVLPSFEAIMKLQEEKKIVGGGLPIGDRAFVIIVRAASNDEVDKMLRGLPVWGALNWKVTALESFAGRAAQERAILSEIQKMSAK